MSAACLADGIAGLAALLDGTDITELTLATGAETLTLRRQAGGRDAAAPGPAGLASHEAASPDTVPVVAPCPGVFLLRHPLREAPLAVVGQAVAQGDVLGLLRAGPLLVQVAAPRSGTVAEVAAAGGAVAGYGTVLFRLSPA